MTRCFRFVSAVALAGALVIGSAAWAANFTTGADPAVKFGVHEIVLTGDGSVANPLDTLATVTFSPPSGAKQAKTVYAFHDGGNTWRARVYISEVGKWSWFSTCKADKALDGKSGAFDASGSKLRGRLLPHPKNPRHWMTEDGRWFLNLVDTAYYLLSPRDYVGQVISEDDFHDYVRDAADHGITSLMTHLITGPRSSTDEGPWTERYFADAGFTRLHIDEFRFSDRRLRWCLDHHPDVGIELILFPRGSRYAKDEQFWSRLTAVQKDRILRYVVARYAAYPQIFWLIANDVHYGENFPNNNAYVREVGAYFQKNDPWRHPMSTGHARQLDFFFGDEEWATYMHLENSYDLGASQCAKHYRFAKPILLGEDRYEQNQPDRFDPVDMRYFQRRLFWAWLFSGGSANYGGRYWLLHPYAQSGQRQAPNPRSEHKGLVHATPLAGLDSVRFIRDYFATREIELSDFEPDDSLAHNPDDAESVRAPKLMRRGYEEFLIYHPNAAADGREAEPRTGRKARVRLDLRKADGPLMVEWYRTHDGLALEGEPVAGGTKVELVAPWPGYDVVLRLRKPSAGKTKSAPAHGPLRIHPTNPRYFTDGTKSADGTFRAVYLTGSHTWNNLVDIGPGDPPAAFDYEAYLDFLEQRHHNFFRLWSPEEVVLYDARHNVAPQPWARTGPGNAVDGKPKFDLSKLNSDYFDRLRSRVEAAGRRGIYVSVMFFEGWTLGNGRDRFKYHPFHHDNNINGIHGDADGDGYGVEVHTLDIPDITRLQEAYIRRVIETVGDLDNVLYEIANESGSYSTAWQYHLIRFVKAVEATRPQQHPVGMTFQWNSNGKWKGTNQALFDSPADWISPNQQAADNWNYKTDPPPSDGKKVILPDTDHLGGIWGTVPWVWMSFTRGHNPIFMDPYDGSVLSRGDAAVWELIRKNLGITYQLARRANLAAMTPQLEIASTKYCLAAPGKDYIVYLPDGGEVTVDLEAAKGKITVEWFNPRTCETREGDTVDSGARRPFQAPFEGDAVLYLRSE